VLLLVVAALAVGGSFGAVWTQGTGDYSTTVTSWALTTSSPRTGASTLARFSGILHIVGALVAVVAAIVIMATGRRPGGSGVGRSLGIAAGALLVGDITFVLGAGAWLHLVAAVIALVAVVLLLVPERRQAIVPPPGWAPGPVGPPPPGWQPPRY
jgi:hypothetical protein